MQNIDELKKVYYNAAQQKVMYTAAKTTVIVGGRRLGKTHGIAAPWLLRNIQRMPRSNGAIVGSTYQQLLTRTLPGTLTALEKLGYRRNVHWVIGRRPPKNFATPHTQPEVWDYTLSFYNGAVRNLISQDREGTSNSHTFDDVMVDEAKFANFDKLKEETFPANGGYRGHFGHLPWHHSMLIISDMPTTKKGSWFLSYKDKCDNELIAAIQGLVYEIWRQEQKVLDLRQKGVNPPTYLKYHMRKLHKDLSELRAIATYYEEMSSIENLQVLGESYIRQMKRDLPPLVFQTSILCKRVGVLTDGFYSALKESVHYYTKFDNSFLDSLNYDFSKMGAIGCQQDGDLLQDEPICIGMDYNANINWIVAGQAHEGKLYVLKSFYVKYERKLRELVDDFCNYYQHKRVKEVIYYYDTTAISSNYAVNNEDFMTVVCDQFRKNRWFVTPVMMGNPVAHSEKHLIINQGLKGQSGLMPMFNKDHNESLCLAMEQTGVRVGPNGFQKDKRGEKLAESDEDKLEHRTDGTDAFDNLYIGCTKFPKTRQSFSFTSMH